MIALVLVAVLGLGGAAAFMLSGDDPTQPTPDAGPTVAAAASSAAPLSQCSEPAHVLPLPLPLLSDL